MDQNLDHEKISFLKRKNVEFSAKRYLQDGLSAMAPGLFASLLVGLILKTLGEQTANLVGANIFTDFLIQIGGIAMGLMGPAIGVAVAHALKAPPLVLFTSVVTGSLGATMTGFGVEVAGGPAGAFVAAAVGCELGKIISKETKLDIVITPAVTLIAGAIAAKFIGPLVGWFMIWLGKLIMLAMDMEPFFTGMFVAILVGLALTAPISSAALCIMMGLTGIAAGASTVGCCCHMVGFAVISFKDNGVGGLVAQGIGTSKLQIANVVKNPWIVVPSVVSSAILGPVASCVFKMTNNTLGAGMGTSGLVGQIGTFTDMGFTLDVLVKVLILHIALPAIVTFIVYAGLKKLGKIQDGDMKLDL